MAGKKTKTTEERFWSKVNKKKEGDCWEWTAGFSFYGYGAFYLDNINCKAHRVAWKLENGEIPKDVCVLHRCDNPKCVNPKHLFLGTIKDNNQDKMKKGRNSRLIGETNGLSKLKEKEILEIRKLYSTKKWTLEKLAKVFRVSFVNIGLIINRKTWKHV